MTQNERVDLCAVEDVVVVRALREHGKKVRFLYSWDDYDVFRKVPKNMPWQERAAGECLLLSLSLLHRFVFLMPVWHVCKSPVKH